MAKKQQSTQQPSREVVIQKEKRTWDTPSIPITPTPADPPSQPTPKPADPPSQPAPKPADPPLQPADKPTQPSNKK